MANTANGRPGEWTKISQTYPDRLARADMRDRDTRKVPRTRVRDLESRKGVRR